MVLQRARWHVEHRHRGHLALVDVGVDPDDPALPLVDLALEAVRRLGDLALRVAVHHRLDHSAAPVDLVEIHPRLPLDLVRERFDEP